MKLMMHVLKKNPKEKLDNERATFDMLKDKLEEEFKEVVQAIDDYCKCKSVSNLILLVGEVFDLIQVCIALLYKCHRRAQDHECPTLIYDVNITHKNKLVARGWIFKTGIEIDIKE
ncbi:nucleoside triphosphate pyrophosphohydrolase family protein [Clostridium culturomicium]|uniref:hypothetical protein n=1 Tax=Clostridium culturomicium TaxID=1499683 RepID=UPI00385738BD